MAVLFLSALGAYLLCGALVAPVFVLFGAGRVDPHAKGGTWGFRVLILPGVVFLWPLMVRRWLAGTAHPPVERTAHRTAATTSSGVPRS
jgi:hypothetical protein